MHPKINIDFTSIFDARKRFFCTRQGLLIDISYILLAPTKPTKVYRTTIIKSNTFVTQTR